MRAKPRKTIIKDRNGKHRVASRAEASLLATVRSLRGSLSRGEAAIREDERRRLLLAIEEMGGALAEAVNASLLPQIKDALNRPRRGIPLLRPDLRVIDPPSYRDIKIIKAYVPPLEICIEV